MTNDSFWVVSDNGGSSSQPIIDFLNERVNELNSKTNGKVIAYFTNRSIPFSDFLHALSKPFDSLDSTKHNAGAKSASIMYQKRYYDFYITDKYHQYELTLFQIVCNDIMPVDILIDDIIAKEALLEEKEQIESLETFADVFKRIVTTNKVTYIISRLMKLTDETEKSITDGTSEEGVVQEQNDSEGVAPNAE